MAETPNNPSLRWLLENLGASRAFILTGRFGFTRVFVAKSNNHLRSAFCLELTAIELTRFQQHWAGQFITLPISREFRCKYMAIRQGFGHANIARKLQMKEDSV